MTLSTPRVNLVCTRCKHFPVFTRELPIDLRYMTIVERIRIRTMICLMIHPWQPNTSQPLSKSNWGLLNIFCRRMMRFTPPMEVNRMISGIERCTLVRSFSLPSCFSDRDWHYFMTWWYHRRATTDSSQARDEEIATSDERSCSRNDWFRRGEFHRSIFY